MEIMIVDNNLNSVRDFIFCLNDISEQINYHVFLDANEALEYIKNHTVDMLCTEVLLKDISGFSLINQAKKIDPRIYAIIVTKTKEYAIEAWTNHVDDYLLKDSLSEYLYSSISYMKKHGSRR